MKNIFTRNFLIAFGVLIFFVVPPIITRAEDAVSITVTPPLIQLGIGPGETWTSALKVTNTNKSDLTVYASLMDFVSADEDGHPRFSPAGDGGDLASWIEVATSAVVIFPETSREIPFVVHVPPNAPPGGHYAAILVGTRPSLDGGDSVGGGSLVKVSGLVSSLLFVKVQGAIVERGGIREFSTDRERYDGPPVNFTLRFENSGNVHLQPQGEIAVTDMWGRERGRIFVNEKTNFGNVLPGSTRRFLLPWEAPSGISGIGRYTATVTLTYGREARQNTNQTIVFWIVPLKETIGSFLGLILGIGLLLFALRRYLRRTLARELGARPSKAEKGREVVLDLRGLGPSSSAQTGRHSARSWSWRLMRRAAFVIFGAAIAWGLIVFFSR